MEVSMANERQVFNRLKSKLQNGSAQLPKIFGNESVNFFLDSFQAQGFTDKTFEPWAPRSIKTKKNEGRALLVQTGKMRRSTRVFSIGPNRVVIGNDDPKARIHIYGGTINKRSRSEVFQRNRLTRGKNKGR